MNAQQTNWIQELIDNATAANAYFAERLEASEGTLMGHGFIVQPHGLKGFVVSFDTEKVEGGYKVTNPRVGTLYNGKYDMFTREDAEKIAASNRNGNGDVSHAIHIRQAWKDAIASNDESIAQMQKLLSA